MPSELRSAAGETVEFEVGPVERDEPAFAIASSNGVEVTTESAHGYAAGDIVRISGHVWNTIDGVWEIDTIVSTTKFTLSGTYSAQSGGATGTVVRVAPIDLTATDTEIVFTAKRHLQDADADAVVAKTSALNGGIALNSPSSARKNLATVTIAPSDTAAILDSEDLYFDVRLEEPDGRITILDYGTWKIRAVAV